MISICSGVRTTGAVGATLAKSESLRAARLQPHALSAWQAVQRMHAFGVQCAAVRERRKLCEQAPYTCVLRTAQAADIGGHDQVGR